MNSVVKLVLLTVLLSIARLEGQESLIERARAGARDGKYVLNIDVYSQVFDVPRLTSESELIVHGRIDGDIQMLSPDSRTVITEYDVIPIKLFKNLTPPGSYPPGVPLKVWMPYGTVRLDDVEITINSNDFPAHECLRSGEEAVLFLTTEETDVTRLRLTGGASGAFRVSNGKVRAMTRDTAKRRGDSANIPLASFNAQIEKALAQR